MNNRILTTGYMTIIVIIGALCLTVAAYTLPLERIDLYFLLLSGLTVGIGSRITIPIPRVKTHIAVSDTFIFLALLLYGGEAAVWLSAIEAFLSSWRFCNKKLTVLFNASAVAISTTVVFLLLKGLGLYSVEKLHGHSDSVDSFFMALSVIAVTQFLVNTSLASLYDSLKNAVPLLETWKRKYVWTFLTYLIGACGAGLLVQLSDGIGFGIIIAAFPIILFVFLTYRMYLKNIEMSVSQAEQAKRYAEIMKEQSDALAESEERFRTAFHYAPIGIGLVSSTGKWLKVNHALGNIFGHSEDEFLCTNFQSMFLPAELDQAMSKIDNVLNGNLASCRIEHRCRHKHGKTLWTSWSVSSVTDSGAVERNLILQIQDITDKKIAEQKLQFEATHDALTRLPNRAYFMRRLASALLDARNSRDFNVSVLFIDLDRFKYVNDSLGHHAGDELLIQISQRLAQCLRPTDMVARLGGDEFVILVEGHHDPAEVILIAERIQQKFEIPFELKGNEVFSSASIGILHASDAHFTAEDMMRDADTAMYQAKRAGKGRHEVFNETMHAAAIETLQLETDLRRAVERGEFSIEYQPIFSLDTDEVESVEALARWRHPELGDISPSRFISLAEEIGIVDMVSAFVLRRACMQIKQLHEEHPEAASLMLNVNLSSRQFAKPTLVSAISNILDETGFSPNDLRLEITESVLFEFQDTAVDALLQLRKLGIDFSVDDFGTGYSNLGYLMQLPVSSLKIDGSFVQMIGKSRGDIELVRTVVSLARNMGMKVVAEGVETEAQLTELRRLDCDGAQGFLLAAPMSYEKLKDFLQNRMPLSLSAIHHEIPSAAGHLS